MQPSGSCDRLQLREREPGILTTHRFQATVAKRRTRSLKYYYSSHTPVIADRRDALSARGALFGPKNSAKSVPAISDH
jgi:hypothetical protein